MKTVSVDAVRQRKLELEGKIGVVVRASQAILDRAETEGRDLTAEEESQFNGHTEAMRPLKAALGRQDFILTEVSAQLDAIAMLAASTSAMARAARMARKILCGCGAWRSSCRR